jgi:predicted dehydrogenase
VNCVIIGFGSIGKKHFKILKENKKIKNIFILSENYSGTNKIKNLNALIKYNIDYFVIANETFKHNKIFNFIEKYFKNKTVLIEKPLFEKNYNYKKKLFNKYYIGYNLRFHPIILKIKKLIRNKKIFNVDIKCNSFLPDWRPNRSYKKIYSSYKKKGGGVLLDLSHEFDYLFFLFGKFNNLISIVKKISNLKIDCEDYAIINGKTELGINFLVNLNFFSKFLVRELVINGIDLNIKADLINNVLTYYIRNKKITKLYSINKDYTYRAMHNNIINKDFKNHCKFDDAQFILKKIDSVKFKEQSVK